MATKSVDDYLIDFSKEIASSGGGVHYKKGTYRALIVAAKPTSSTNKNTPGLELTLKFTEGKMKGKKIKDTLWATPKAYSRFRSLLEACGKKVPSKVNLIKIASAVKGESLYVEIDDEPAREGYKVRSRVAFDGYINESDYDPDAVDEEDEDEDDVDDDEDEEDEDEDGEEDDDEDEDEEEEDDEDDEDPLADLDRKALKALIAKEKLGVKVKTSMDEDDIRDAIREAQAQAEDDDEEDEEEEEEPPAKKRTRKAKPAAKAKKRKAKPKDDDDEDLEDLDLDQL